MPCPDELTLDLWLADALPPDEAATVSAHVGTCAACVAWREAWTGQADGLRAALALDWDEHAYLAGLDLAATWRGRTANATDARWGWLALFAVITAFITWTVAAQPFGDVLSTANEVGLSTVLLTSTIGLVIGVSQSVIDISTNPALGFSQPLLGLLALALLLWPKYMQGVRS